MVRNKIVDFQIQNQTKIVGVIDFQKQIFIYPSCFEKESVILCSQLRRNQRFAAIDLQESTICRSPFAALDFEEKMEATSMLKNKR